MKALIILFGIGYFIAVLWAVDGLSQQAKLKVQTKTKLCKCECQ